MKGGFYGLGSKQVSLILMAFVCTIIFIWGWDSSILTNLLPPQSRLFQLSPDVLFGAPISSSIHSKPYTIDNNNISLFPLKDIENVQDEHHLAVAAPIGSAEGSPEIVETNSTKKTITVEEKEMPGIVAKEEAKSKQISDKGKSREETEVTEQSVNIVAPTTPSQASPSLNENDKAISVDKQETPAVTAEKLENEQNFEGDKSPKEVKQSVDIVAPVPFENASSSASGSGTNNTTLTEKQACNYAKGKWVVDSKRPLYSGFGCKQWLSKMWSCRLTQRMDFDYETFKWQPKNCKTEEFERSKFFKRMQDKTLAFIGDSLGRQQFQSLMCMVTGGDDRPDVLDVGKEYGLVKHRGSVRPDGWAYRFPETNTTILYYWSASLSKLEPLNITNPTTDYAMHLDRPPWFLQQYIHKLNVLVLNTGHHWNRGKLKANRWIMYVDGKPNTNRKIADIAGAKNFTVFSIVKWVNSQLPKYPHLKAFYRSISPRHFFNGDWNSGGTCDNTTPQFEGKEVLQDESSDQLAAGAVKGTNVTLLDITAVSQLRDEGHISRYSIKATPGVQDCLHWCLPGIPDTWNEVLFAQI